MADAAIGTLELLAAWLRWVAPPGTAVATGSIQPSRAFDEIEAECVAGAVTHRRDEFHTGRALARLALMELGCPPQPIPVAELRLPVWPFGYVGSISHCDDICVAHVARSQNVLSIGVDIERAGAVSLDLIAEIASLEEWRQLCDENAPGVDPATLCFSAKEAFYKAYFPATRRFLDFTDVRIDVDWKRGSFTALLLSNDKPTIGGCLQGRFAGFGDHIATAVWLTP